jgi:hypothetical protein
MGKDIDSANIVIESTLVLANRIADAAGRPSRSWPVRRGIWRFLAMIMVPAQWTRRPSVRRGRAGRLTLRHTCPGRDIRLLAIRDKLGHVVVKLGHRLVERSEPGSVCPCELCQVSIGHLTVTDDSLGGDVGVRDIVGPEFMPRVSGGAVEDLSCRAGAP